MNYFETISKRYSTVAFDSRPIEEEKISFLFEAARWAPSARNIQPWRFYYVTGGALAFKECITVLVPANQVWAQHAGLLVLAAAELSTEKGSNRYAAHDVGMATANLLNQATALGLASHPMGGFDAEGAGKLFSLPAVLEPLTIIAIGYPADSSGIRDELKSREQERLKRTRKEIKDFVIRIT